MKGLTRFVKRRLPFWQLYVFMLPPLAYLILFRYVPMVGVQIAFKKFNIMDGIWGSPWVGFMQFEKFVTAYQFRNVMGNTLTLAVYGILAGFPFPILFALAINTMRHPRLKKTLQTITYMPHFISTVVIVGMMMQLFHPLSGVFAQLYKSLTGRQMQDLFGSANAFAHLYVWSDVWQGFGYGSIIYIAALTGVSPELYEAAEVDGASRFQRILHVDIPSILPTITIMLILRTGSVMSVGFEKVYLMQNSLNLRTSEVISTFVYKKGLGSGVANDYSYSAAIGLFNAVINMALIVTVNFISRRLSETSLW